MWERALARCSRRPSSSRAPAAPGGMDTRQRESYTLYVCPEVSPLEVKHNWKELFWCPVLPYHRTGGGQMMSTKERDAASNVRPISSRVVWESRDLVCGDCPQLIPLLRVCVLGCCSVGGARASDARHEVSNSPVIDGVVVAWVIEA